MSSVALQAKLRRQLAALDDLAFEALASRGLLRRARKDLETVVPIVTSSEADAALRMQVGEWEVTLSVSGPTQSRCSCPAAGVCQHILSACLWLRDQSGSGDATEVAESAPVAGQAGQELLRITLEEMEKWAGRASLRAAHTLAAQAETEISQDGAVTVSFRFLNAACRFVPETGLDGAIVTGPPKDAQRLVLAALLVFQKSRGIAHARAEEEAATALGESRGAARSREEVLASAASLLCESVQTGLAHATSATCERFSTLSVSAVAVNLPRLALMLRAIGHEFRLSLARDAAADSSRIFSTVARAYALCAALERAGAAAPAGLVGMHRATYSEVGNLDLAGLAAWPWETASGYRGLTVLFWDVNARSWNTWSEARPRHLDSSYDPGARFNSGGPWDGAESPEQVSRSRFRLLHARRNPAGRLSASSKSRALVTAPTMPLDLSLPIATTWTQLTEVADRANPIGLAEANPLDSICIARPAAWGQRVFDPVSQTLYWSLADGEGENLLLQVRFNPVDEPAIKALESLDPATLPGTCIVGRIARTPAGLILHPHSLITSEGAIRHLVLDQQKKSPAAVIPSPAHVLPSDEPEDVEEEDTPLPEVPDRPVARFIGEIEDLLTAMSEGGSGALTPQRRDKLASLIRRAKSIGWQMIPASLGDLAEWPALSPQLLLQCRHICQLYRQASELT